LACFLKFAHSDDARVKKLMPMGSNLSTAFMLLVVGMITVFVALSLIVGVGELLIRLVNRLTPTIRVDEPETTPSSHAIAADKVAAIVAAIDWATEGQGQPQSIEPVIDDDTTK
jgi:oxaloacetate decarboxylase gamma subunit